LPSASAIISISSARSGERDIVFLTAVAIQSPPFWYELIIPHLFVPIKQDLYERRNERNTESVPLPTKRLGWVILSM
jgi:hypothetical protein